MKKRFFVLASFLIANLSAKSQEIIRNLGFEQIDPRGQILCWNAGNTKEAYTIKLDTSVSHSGNGSMSVASLSNVIVDRGVAGAENILFSPDLRSKRSVKVSAYIKTQGMTDGFAGIAMRLNGSNSAVAQTDSGKDSKSGDTEWTFVEIELPLTPEVKSLSFALQVTGRGMAWFDDFQISIDGKTIASSTHEDKNNLYNVR